MRKISILDIAKESGVSKTTVSFVLNGKGEEKNISKETQLRIHETIKRLNYEPNFLAQSLKHGKSHLVAYIVPDISNPFFARLGREIEKLLSKHDYHLMFSSSDENPEKEESLINSFLRRQVDGLIIASSDLKSESIKNLIKRDIPTTFFDRKDEETEANFITTENKESTKKVVKHLISKGCSRIGIMSLTPNIYSLKRRIEGYLEALIEHDKKIDKALIRTVDNKLLKDSCKQELQFLLNSNVDAIVFTNNQLAAEGIWLMNKYHKQKIHNVEFASFDNIELFDYSIPRVTSIAQPIEMMAKTIVKVLVKNMNDSKFTKERIVLESDLIIRS